MSKIQVVPLEKCLLPNMVAGDIVGAKNFLLLANILNSLRIDKLVVPEVVPMTSSEVILDCQYTAADDRFLLQWFVNGSDHPVYQWRPWNEPQVFGILEGKIDLSYRASTRIMEERRALRIVELTPELSGEYTCVLVADDGAEVRRSATMMVFSPEHDFTLQINKNETTKDMVARCSAKGLYPIPELILEHNGVTLRKQVQRVWRTPESLYDVDATSEMTGEMARNTVKVTCRLMLPQAGYVVIKEDHVGGCKSEQLSSNARRVTEVVKLYGLVLYLIR